MNFSELFLGHDDVSLWHIWIFLDISTTSGVTTARYDKHAVVMVLKESNPLDTHRLGSHCPTNK